MLFTSLPMPVPLSWRLKIFASVLIYTFSDCVVKDNISVVSWCWMRVLMKKQYSRWRRISVNGVQNGVEYIT